MKNAQEKALTILLRFLSHQRQSIPQIDSCRHPARGLDSARLSIAPNLIDHPKFATNKARQYHISELIAIFDESFVQRKLQELEEPGFQPWFLLKRRSFLGREWLKIKSSLTGFT